MFDYLLVFGKIVDNKFCTREINIRIVLINLVNRNTALRLIYYTTLYMWRRLAIRVMNFCPFTMRCRHFLCYFKTPGDITVCKIRIHNRSRCVRTIIFFFTTSRTFEFITFCSRHFCNFIIADGEFYTFLRMPISIFGTTTYRHSFKSATVVIINRTTCNRACIHCGCFTFRICNHIKVHERSTCTGFKTCYFKFYTLKFTIFFTLLINSNLIWIPINPLMYRAVICIQNSVSIGIRQELTICISVQTIIRNLRIRWLLLTLRPT